MEQTKFAYSLLGKAFEKQTKTFKEQVKKQVEALEVLDAEKNQKLKWIEGLFLKEMKNNEVKNEIDEIKKWENKIKIKGKDLIFNRFNIYIYIYIYI